MPNCLWYLVENLRNSRNTSFVHKLLTVCGEYVDIWPIRCPLWEESSSSILKWKRIGSPKKELTIHNSFTNRIFESILQLSTHESLPLYWNPLPILCLDAWNWNILPFSESSQGNWKICISEAQTKAQGFKSNVQNFP